MINLFSGELYKLQKSKSIYICCITMIAFVLLLYGAFATAEKIQQGELENGSYGFEVDAEANHGGNSVWEEVSMLEVVQTMFVGIGGIISAIFISIFVFGEYANGAVKNVTGKGYSRWKIFSIKYIATILAALLMLIIMIVAVLIAEILFVGTGRFNSELFSNLVSYASMQLLLATAFGGIVIVINQFCRNLGAGIAISVCLIMFSTIITAGLDIALRYFKLNIKASDYWIVDLINNCPLNEIDSAYATRAIISSIIWIIVTFIIGNVHFQKTDIK